MTAPRLNEYQESRAMRDVAEGLVLYREDDAPWWLVVLVVVIFLALPFLSGIDEQLDAWWIQAAPTQITSQENR